MTEKTYTVVGMTCAHCVRAVREEVSNVAGVAAVDVDLTSGRVRVRADELSDAAVGEAVLDAGYEVRRSA
jgi:copper chaperone